MKKYFVFITTLIVMSFLKRLEAQGNLVFNGGFDTNVGWIINTGFSYYNGKNGNPPGEFVLDGPSSINPTISQPINSLTPGAVYVLSGDFQKLGGSSTNTDPSFGVAIDGMFLFEAVAPPDSNWHSFSFLYTATSLSAMLSLSSQLNGTGISYGIDNIAMQVVPEPSGLWLMAVGGIACARFHKNRRKRLL